MTKKEARALSNESLIKCIAINNAKETKKSTNTLNICIEELAYRKVVDVDKMKSELGL